MEMVFSWAVGYGGLWGKVPRGETAMLKNFTRDLKWAKRELTDHFRNADFGVIEMSVNWDIGYSMSVGEPGIRPNEMGIRLLVWWEYLFLQPYIITRMAFCSHDYHDESWAGPESGGDGGTCVKCGHSFHHVYY